jgi:outer membrane protein OmpA-like peptidoglycan-associated protein
MMAGLSTLCSASANQVVCQENYTFDIRMATAEKITTYVAESRGKCSTGHKLAKEQREINIFNYIKVIPVLQMSKSLTSSNRDTNDSAALNKTALNKISIHFGLGSSEISASERKFINTFVTSLSPDAVVDVIGHSCWIGSEEYNIVLSKRRASNIAEYLKSMKINVRQEEGKGESMLIDKINPAPNRRVDIIPVKKGGDGA